VTCPRCMYQVPPAIILVREALAFAPRSRKLLATKPPPGSGTTEFSPIGSGAIAHPGHVKTGVLLRASTWKTSMDSLFQGGLRIAYRSNSRRPAWPDRA
jgi:hypothetical protein